VDEGPPPPKLAHFGCTLLACERGRVYYGQVRFKAKHIQALCTCTRKKHPGVPCLRCFFSVVVLQKIFSPKEILEFLEANEKQRPVVIR
jgi:hypothetical protein